MEMYSFLKIKWVVLKRTFCENGRTRNNGLTAEAVERAALALERVDHVHGGDGLALGVLRVGDRVADHVLQEHLQHPAGLLVDEAGDALDSATAGQAADGGLGDALNVIAEDFAVALGATLAKTFPSLAAARHNEQKLRVSSS